MRFLILSFFFVLTYRVQAQKTLFPIVENGQYGFIDTTGNVIITPRFKAVGTFSEGLAAAREGGYYGYIDTKGDWHIPPQYDYATAFSEGLAIVFKNGKPFYIDNKGQKPFAIHKEALAITPFKNGVARIEIGKYTFLINKVGLIDKTGKWLLEPIYRNIFTYKGSLIKVIFDKKKKHTEGLIDTLGHWFIPMNIYKSIGQFKGNFAKITFLPQHKNEWGDDGFINPQHEVVYCLKSSNTLSISYDAIIQDSVFVIRRGRIPKGNHVKKNKSLSYEWRYDGLMNLKGVVLLDSFSIEHLTPIGDGIFEARDRQLNTLYFDKYGKRLSLSKYELSEIQAKKDKQTADYYLAIKNQNQLNKTYQKVISISSKTDTLDVDYMYYTDFYAYSKSDGNDSIMSNSPNWAHAIPQEMGFPNNQFTIEIRTTDTLHLEGKWMGYKVFVANNTKNTFCFDAQDSRLSMNMQAIDEQGVWRDIEYLPSSGCVYHILTLDPKQYWQFQAPLYKGSTPTRLRLKLMVKREKSDKSYEVYSNEIKGSVNPAQFWRKQDYYPNGIMDTDND